MKFIGLLNIAICCLFAIAVSGQNEVEPLTQKEKEEVIDSISSIMKRTYVFPDIADQIAEHLKENLRNGEYTTSDPNEWAQQLTDDVRSVNDDKHLRVRFAPEMINERRNASMSEEDSLAMIERMNMRNERNNYGFQEVKIMDGNIGYLNLTGFYHTAGDAGRVASSAMNFLANSDAIIIDLRRNGGGSPAMIQLISSYLFGEESVHLNNFYWRPEDSNTQTWTLPYVPGKRNPDALIYVLTSNRTFSAAEEFTYNLRNLERATIVGETTGGGAHPGGTRIATDRYAIWVPSGRAINPITKTNWEGTGVAPHKDVSSEKALDVAYMDALEKLSKKNPDMVFEYNWLAEQTKAMAEPAEVDPGLLASYEGSYGPRKLMFKNGKLIYKRGDNPSHELIAMNDTMFMFKDASNFRLEIIMEEGEVIGVRGHYDDGRTDEHMRDKM